jgi:hypothetical protein
VATRNVILLVSAGAWFFWTMCIGFGYEKFMPSSVNFSQRRGENCVETNPPFPVIINPSATLNFHLGNMIFPHLQEEKMIVSGLSCINLIPA